MGIAHCDKRTLRFHKRGSDRSGKCDAFYTGNSEDVVIGVLYRIPESEKPRRDTFEGLGSGYSDEPISIVCGGRVLHNVATYVADPAAIDAGLRPYQWYKDFVVLGARSTVFRSPTSRGSLLPLTRAVTQIQLEKVCGALS